MQFCAMLYRFKKKLFTIYAECKGHLKVNHVITWDKGTTRLLRIVGVCFFMFLYDINFELYYINNTYDHQFPYYYLLYE